MINSGAGLGKTVVPTKSPVDFITSEAAATDASTAATSPEKNKPFPTKSQCSSNIQ